MYCNTSPYLPWPCYSQYHNRGGSLGDVGRATLTKSHYRLENGHANHHGIESLRRYAKCTSIALQHAYQHTTWNVCSRADVGRRRVNPNADRVSRVAHAPLRFGRLGTIAAAPPTRHAAPNSMPFDDLAARREPDRFSATMRAALQTPPCEPSRRNPLPTCTWPGKSRRRP